VLHVLNGDATAAVFPSTLPGERAVWGDILMEGPAATDTETRAAWLAPRLGVGIDDYARRWREGQSMLAHAKEHDEVVLWFEQDLFCATNLWFVLDRLEAARVSLVFPPLSAGGGLRALTPDTFEPLFERRRALTAADIADARALWRAYAAPEPLSLTRLQPTLPFAPAAVGLHCARFPSVVDGLDDVEHATLGALDDPLAFGALFRRVTRSAELSELAWATSSSPRSCAISPPAARRCSRSSIAIGRSRTGASGGHRSAPACSPAAPTASHWCRSTAGSAACTCGRVRRSGVGTASAARSWRHEPGAPGDSAGRLY